MRRLQIAAFIILALGLGAGAVRLHAFVSSGHAWGVSDVSYYINPQNLYVSPESAIAAVQSAASNWNTQSGANVRLVYAGTTNANTLTLDHTNNVFFRNDSSSYIAETYWWYDGTGRLVDADIVFHEGFRFYTGNAGCNGDGYSIENTGTHEFGHALGLAHSPVSTATMWATSETCATWKETLDPDDISGAQSLYSASTSSGPPTAPSQLQAAVSAGSPASSLVMSWVDSATNANGYSVERSLDGAKFGQIAQLGSNATGYVDSGLSSGWTYYYRVSAFNNAGNSAYSNVAAGQTQSPPVTTAPSVPTNPSPSDGTTGVNTNVTLAWSCTGGQTFDVYINGSLYVSNVTTASVAVNSLAVGATYSWSVVAHNNAGATSGPTWSFTTKRTGRKNG